jgi:hypothetical protein
MADLTEQQLLSTDPEVLGLQRQRQLANLLTGQAFNQPQGQVISGHYVKPSALQQALPMINAGIGALTNANLDTKQQELAQLLQQKKAMATQDILGAAMGQELPAQAGPMPNGGNIAIQRTPADMAKALRLAMADTTGAGATLTPSLLEQSMPKQIPEQIKYKAAQEGGYKGTFNDFINQMSDKDRASLAIEQQRLNLEKARLANEQSGGKLSEFQGKATNFGVQMAGSTKEMAAVEKAGFDPTSTKNQVLLSAAGTGLGNYVVPPQVQRYKQAMDNFTENYIRFKSGANVPMHEIESDLKNMMPQPGDGVDKLEQKQRARERALQGMAISAGPGAKFISQAYNTEAPGMKNETPAQTGNSTVTPSLWGKATVVSQ